MTQKNETATKYADMISPRLSTYELILCLISFTAIALKMSGIQASGIILTVSLLLLGIIYFICSYATTSVDTPKFEKFVAILTMYGSALSVVGVLFLIQNWKGFDRMIIASLGVHLFAIIFCLVKTNSSQKVIRPLIFIVILSVLFFTPTEKLVDLHIKNQVDNTNN